MAFNELSLPFEGTFFFTEVDPEAALKDSRDPLGFQPVWSHFGRKLVGNLTTVTTSVRGFTTLLLGHWVAGQLVESAKIDPADYIEPFLRFEQVAAYSRFAWQSETGDPVNTIRGIRRVEARFSEGNGRVRIATDRDGQILSNQKTYGLWGLYSVAAENSGLLSSKRDRLQPAALKFLEDAVLPILDDRLKEGRHTLLRFLTRQETYFEPKGTDKALGKTLASLLSPHFGMRELEFYAEHLVSGTHCHPDGRQKRLWERMDQSNRPETWQHPFGMMELEVISGVCQASEDTLDRLVGKWLENIRLLELVLAPAEQAFDFLLGQRGQPFALVSGELQRRWEGAFDHLDPARLDEFKTTMAEALGETGGEFTGWLQRLSSAFRYGRFEEVVRLVLVQNEQVMQRRGGGPWATLKGDRIEVRYSDQTGEPTVARELPRVWRNTYFLNALKVVGESVFMKGVPE